MKIKPLKFPPRVKHTPVVDYGRLYKRMSAVIPAKAADNLVHDLMELDGVCDDLRRDIKLLFRALSTAKRDATDLHDASSFIGGDFEEFMYHIRSGRRGIKKLNEALREMPPLDKANDEQLSARSIDAAMKSLYRWTKKSKMKKAKKAKKK